MDDRITLGEILVICGHLKVSVSDALANPEDALTGKRFEPTAIDACARVVGLDVPEDETMATRHERHLDVLKTLAGHLRREVDVAWVLIRNATEFGPAQRGGFSIDLHVTLAGLPFDEYTALLDAPLSRYYSYRFLRSVLDDEKERIKQYG